LKHGYLVIKFYALFVILTFHYTKIGIWWEYHICLEKIGWSV